MKRVLVLAVLGLVFFVGQSYAKDITITNIPEELSDSQVKEWMSILVERLEEQKIQAIPELAVAVKTGQTSIDSFRKANSLQPKFEAVPVAEPIEEPVVEPVVEPIAEPTEEPIEE
jgi:hypothetical protein